MRITLTNIKDQNKNDDEDVMTRKQQQKNSFTAALVRSQVRRLGICGEHSSPGTRFLRVLRIPQIRIPATAPRSLIILLSGAV
jgi:hypothetical protein